jgi:hypothetical protein
MALDSPDTEEVTGSNPVRPTQFFEILSSAKGPKGSQPPAALALRCWSEHSTVWSTGRLFPVLTCSAEDLSSCHSHSDAACATKSEGLFASHRADRRLGLLARVMDRLLCVPQIPQLGYRRSLLTPVPALVTARPGARLNVRVAAVCGRASPPGRESRKFSGGRQLVRDRRPQGGGGCRIARSCRRGPACAGCAHPDVIAGTAVALAGPCDPSHGRWPGALPGYRFVVGPRAPVQWPGLVTTWPTSMRWPSGSRI